MCSQQRKTPGCCTTRYPLAPASRNSCPLPIPLPVTPGILGATELGIARVKAISHHYFGEQVGKLMEQWLNHLLMTEWLTAIAKKPKAFAMTWWSRCWMAQSLQEGPACSPPMCSAVINNCWLQAQCTLAYQLHTDFIEANATQAMHENFWHYMKRAFNGLFLSGGLEGWVPLELASKLWYLCPPSMMHSWHRQFGFTGFTNDVTTITPLAWNYITVTIPVVASMPWTPTPLKLTGCSTKHQWHPSPTSSQGSADSSLDCKPPTHGNSSDSLPQYWQAGQPWWSLSPTPSSESDHGHSCHHHQWCWSPAPHHQHTRDDSDDLAASDPYHLWGTPICTKPVMAESQPHIQFWIWQWFLPATITLTSRHAPNKLILLTLAGGDWDRNHSPEQQDSQQECAPQY